MKIEWKLTSGFDGQPVHHLFEIDDELIKECETYEEAVDLVDRETDYMFMDSIDWNFCNPKHTADELKKIFESK